MGVGEGMVDGIADPGLGGQVHHAADAVVAHQRRHVLGLGDVRAHKLKAVASQEGRHARLLQRHVVIGVEIVDPDHRLAAIEEPLGHGPADEAGCAGDQDGRCSAQVSAFLSAS